MSGTWASTSVDLHLDLAGSRIREALERALRDAARTGRLAPGLQLPSSRALAADLGLARNTVTDAYGQLIAEGILQRSHRGAVVAEPTRQDIIELYELREALEAARRKRMPRLELLVGLAAAALVGDGVVLVLRWLDRLHPWAMVEVFLVGVFVAYTRLVGLATVDVGAAAWALGV